MAVSHSASALGEAIGKLIEDELERIISPACQNVGYYYDRGGKRPDKRRGVKLAMINKSGNEYQLDGVVETPDGKPIVLLESKYLRYKKHNRDKASWTCAAHYSLRKSHPTVRKSIAVLSGNWSLPSKRFLESFGIELFEISFEHMCKTMRKFGVKFDWPEKNREIPERAWKKYKRFDENTYNKIGKALVSPIKTGILKSIRLTMKGGEDWVKRVKEIELLLKTDRHEYLTSSFKSTKKAIQYLLDLQIDAPDLRDVL